MLESCFFSVVFESRVVRFGLAVPGTFVLIGPALVPPDVSLSNPVVGDFKNPATPPFPLSRAADPHLLHEPKHFPFFPLQVTSPPGPKQP
jgi:hypothetical protein